MIDFGALSRMARSMLEWLAELDSFAALRFVNAVPTYAGSGRSITWVNLVGDLISWASWLLAKPADVDIGNRWWGRVCYRSVRYGSRHGYWHCRNQPVIQRLPRYQVRRSIRSCQQFYSLLRDTYDANLRPRINCHSRWRGKRRLHEWRRDRCRLWGSEWRNQRSGTAIGLRNADKKLRSECVPPFPVMIATSD